MTRISKLGAIAFLGLGLVVGTAAAQEPVTIGVAAEPYPPFTEQNASGEWEGFEIDFAKALCEEMQVECVTSAVAWDGIIPALTSGNIDMIVNSMSITEERRQTIEFSDRYYYTASVFVAAAGSGLDVSPEGMQGKILGVQTGTTNADYAAQVYTDGVELKYYNTQDEVNADLVAGRVDAMLADQLAMDAFLKSEAGAGMEQVAVAPEHAAFGEGIGVGVRKEDTELLGKVNAAIASLLESGKYDEVAKNYFDFDIYGPRS